jgi:hypothetical protein
MRSPDLLVRLDLAVRRDGSVTRVRVLHGLRGSTVHVLASGQGGLEVRAVDVRDWRAELAAVCRVVPPRRAPAPPSRACRDLPWELIVGSGAALAAHRQDLDDELLGRAGSGAREHVARLHLATVGRLRVVGTTPGRRRIGWVSWVLFADGWRALTPYVAGGPAAPRAMVRVEQRDPDDLARDVAHWAARAMR